MEKIFQAEMTNKSTGLFSYMSWVLEILLFCERDHDDIKYFPEFVFRNAYAEGHPEKRHNWFNYYFEVIRKPNDCSAKIEQHVGTTANSIIGNEYYTQLLKMSIHDASKLFKKYIRIKPFLQEAATEFIVENKMNLKETVAVHYRGSDKMYSGRGGSETNYVSPIEAFTRARNHEPTASLFVATDDYEFLKVAKASPEGCFFYGGKMANGENPVHCLPGVGFADGADAIVNVLIMSECKHLLKTPSTMSAWAAMLNPNLKVTMLEPLKLPWFPESLL